MIAAFAAFEAILQVFLPAERFTGPQSPAGHRPVYKVHHPYSSQWLLAMKLAHKRLSMHAPEPSPSSFLPAKQKTKNKIFK
jgi:hypothetical protein